MATDFSATKSIFVLGVVVGCFAVLWPNIFYPMFVGSYTSRDPEPSNQGCCDVIFDSDVNAIKVMTELCQTILLKSQNFESHFALTLQQGKLTNAIVKTCQQTVLSACGVDITEFLIDKVRLGVTYKQMLDGIRSLNSSLCLKHKFGVSFGEIGLPRPMRIWGLNRPKHHRQERPPHLRPDFLHPALRERGQAIPSLGTGRRTNNNRDGRVQTSTTLPGIRPPMGGAGHVVPPPKTGSTLGILMPMYTVGIVVFFMYTLMKLVFKKSGSDSNLESYTPDPDFQRTVFNDCGAKNHYPSGQESHGDSKIGWRERDAIVSAISGLVEEVNKQIRSEESLQTPDKDVVENNAASQPETTSTLGKEECGDEENFQNAEDSSKGVVKVLGMEMTESCEKGAKWSRPATPLSRPATPQNIYIQGSLPSQSQLLVSDSHTETGPATDNAFVLTGKVTLSLIGVDAENENDSDEPVESQTAASNDNSGGESGEDVNQNEVLNGNELMNEVVKEEEISEEEVEEEEEEEEKEVAEQKEAEAKVEEVEDGEE